MISTPSLRSSLALLGAAGLVLASATAHAFEPGDVFAGVDGQLRAFTKGGSHIVTVDLGGMFSTGACLLPNGHLLVTTWYDNEIIEVGGAGQWIGPWGSRKLKQPESCTVDAVNGWVYFGQSGFGAGPDVEPHPQIHRFSLDGTWSRAFDVDYGWGAAGGGASQGTDTIALAPDNCTLAYSSEGQLVRHYDVCRDVQMAAAQPLGVMQLGQMTYAPNGDLYVADVDNGFWRFPAGMDAPDRLFQVQDTLDPGYTPHYLYSLTMADSKHLLVGDYFGHVYRHNIETDLTVQVFDSFANVPGGMLMALATVFESSGPTEGVPPLCACADRVVIADENCQAPADVNAGATGLPAPTCTASPAAPYSAGDTDVTLTCNSALGSCQCVGRVTVRDVTPPAMFGCPAADIEAGCSQGATWAITGADACGATTVQCTSGGNVVTSGAIFPPGTSMVTCVVRDAAGNSSAPCNFNVVVTGGSVATPPTKCDGLWDKCQTTGKYCDKYTKYCTDESPTKCDGLEEKCLRHGKYCDKYQKYCLGWTKCETLEEGCFGANDTKACDKLNKYCIGVDDKPSKCDKLSDKCINDGKYCDKYAKYCTDTARPDKCDKLEYRCTVEGEHCDKFQKYCLGGAKPDKCDTLFVKCGNNPGSNYCEKYAKYCTNTDKPEACDKMQAKCQYTGKYCDKYAKYCTDSVTNPKCDEYEQKCLGEGKYCDKFERYCAVTCAPPPAPTCLCKSVTVYASGVGMAVPSIDNGSTSSDGSPLSCTQTPSGPFTTGTTTATLSCTAAGGASCSCQGDITVTTAPPAPKPALDLFEDEEPYQSWERERERACLTATWPFKLSDCFENPPIDQLSGGPVVDNPAVGRITRVEWWPNVEAGANAATRAIQSAEWRASYQKRGACQGGPLQITGPTTVNLPLDELEDPHQLYSVYRIYYSLTLAGSTTNNVCYFRLRGRFDDEAKIAALPAEKQPVPGVCTVCASADNSCGTCPSHAQVCVGAPTNGNCKR